MRIGHGYDAHRFENGRKLYLCGILIPEEDGLAGHSDADVGIHALMDAMLGAAALGDIGVHFPPSDMQYKDIRSTELLRVVKDKIEKAGYSLGNADITIIAQKPRLSPYISDMRKTLADVLGTEPGNINIKATTTEKMGFTGRCEGIAAEAVCLLNKRI